MLSFVVPASAALGGKIAVGGERKRLPSNMRPCPGHPLPCSEQTKLPGTTALTAELASIREKWACCGVRGEEGRASSWQGETKGRNGNCAKGGVKKRAEDRQDRLKPVQDGVVSLGRWQLREDQTLLQCGM